MADLASLPSVYLAADVATVISDEAVSCPDRKSLCMMHQCNVSQDSL